MSLDSRISSLEAKHHKLEEEIRSAYLSHLSEETITDLKRKKLHIKEELSNIKNSS